MWTVTSTPSAYEEGEGADTPERRYPVRVQHAVERYTPSKAFAAFGDPELLDPKTVSEALHAAHLKQAMDAEMAALIENGTWELVNALDGTKALPCKWIYKLKYNVDGSVEHFKARLVVGKHRQVEGIDDDNVYTPVERHATFRMLAARAAMEDWELESLDISNAFINGVPDQSVSQLQLFTCR